jgi:hypothetical protein
LSLILLLKITEIAEYSLSRSSAPPDQLSCWYNGQTVAPNPWMQGSVMPNSFPGMDPYLEDDLWTSVHTERKAQQADPAEVF